MKIKFSACLFSIALVSYSSGQGLYYVGNEAQESLPLKWVVGASAFYDDNVNAGNSGPQEGSAGLNPYVGLSFINVTPQASWDVYVRLGLLYYADAPPGVSTTNSQSRAGVNFTHRFSERLRFTSRNFIAYELNPDYATGVSNSSNSGEYLNWSSDNSIGFRWTERLGSYTGITLFGNSYQDSSNNDIFTVTLYNQLRYQLGPQTIITQDYRYAMNNSNGVADDSTDQYILVGLEQRFSPKAIGIIRGGVQLHSVDDGGSGSTGGDSYASPYLELAYNNQISQQFSLRAFARYGIESDNTVQYDSSTATNAVFNDTRSFRIGLSSQYIISPMFSVVAGLDYIPTSYEGGQNISAPYNDVSDLNSNMINMNIGLSAKFNDYLTGSISYNFTDSTSDIDDDEYTRNRVSLGVSAEF